MGRRRTAERPAARVRAHAHGTAAARRRCRRARDRLERDDGVDPAGGEMAEGERERAHDAECEERSRPWPGDVLATRRSCVASNDRISISLLRARAVEAASVEERALATPCRPLLAACRSRDEAEVDISHRGPFGHRDREREEGDPALRVHASVDRVDDDHEPLAASPNRRSPSSSDTSVKSAVGMKRFEARDNRALRGLVDRSRLVSALARLEGSARARRGSAARRAAPDGVRRLAADLEPVGHSSKGEKRRPLVSFGKK